LPSHGSPLLTVNGLQFLSNLRGDVASGGKDVIEIVPNVLQLAEGVTNHVTGHRKEPW
jgi:hypothetical protein